MNIKGLITAIFAGSAIVNSSNPNPDNKYLRGSHAPVAIPDYVSVKTSSNIAVSNDLSSLVSSEEMKKIKSDVSGKSKKRRNDPFTMEFSRRRRMFDHNKPQGMEL
ncbi:hypothetical protein SZ25_00231 [Candidatus Arcanobacter lacustris]|jgi:hypothetical protein|uniref:Uncharacterized protein n=1 Tax=Candidatus Arcanibacter lacustris TaxID=1607817 RepID=A0A0F5MPF6_9RICK|nr:hypothetical protein SZ25_00231 [Candidatus Arcanobacter lacustris]